MLVCLVLLSGSVPKSIQLFSVSEIGIGIQTAPLNHESPISITVFWAAKKRRKEIICQLLFFGRGRSNGFLEPPHPFSFRAFFSYLVLLGVNSFVLAAILRYLLFLELCPGTFGGGHLYSNPDLLCSGKLFHENASNLFVLLIIAIIESKTHVRL